MERRETLKQINLAIIKVGLWQKKFSKVQTKHVRYVLFTITIYAPLKTPSSGKAKEVEDLETNGLIGDLN